MSRSAWWKRLTPAHFASRNRCRWAKNHEIRLHVTRLEERRVLDAAVLVADLNPGAADGSPSQFTQHNGSLYFSAAGLDSGGADVGRELFRLDPNGHVSLVADIRPGSAGSDPGEFTAYRGSLYFAATGPDGRELYRLDAGGHVSQVADIAAGHASSNPAGFTEFDGKLHFAATGSRGRELYKVDDANRVHLVSDIRYGPWSSDPREFTEYAGKLYFAATGWEGRELFALNRGGQVHQVGDIFPWWGSSNPEELIVCNGSLYFAATSFFGGRTLVRCDSSGHCTPSSAFGDGVRIANPEGLTESDGNLFFQASLYEWGGSHGDSQLYVLDVRDHLSKVLTTDGASLTEASGFTRFNGSLVVAADTSGGRGLFRLQSGGEYFQAVAIALPPGVTLRAGEPTEFAAFPVVDGDLYFRALGPTGTELYRVNGNDEVNLAADVNAGSAGSYPREFVVFENRLYFSAETAATGREMYCLLPDPSLVVIAGSDLVFTDIAGEDNAVVVFSDGCNLHIRDDNGHTIFASLPYVTGSGTNEVVIPLANLTYVRRIVVNTKSGTDSLSLDLSDNADSVLAHFDSVVYDGGSNGPSVRGDVLRLIGDGWIDAVVTPDGHVTGSGQATVSGAAGHMTVNFRDVEPVDVTGMSLAKLTVPITATLCDALVISDGKDALTDTRAALVVSGTVGGLPIESVHLFANREVAVETGSGAAAACDHVLIASAWGWHENGSLTVVTGQTCDQCQSVVSIEGDVALSGDLHVRSGRIVVDASVTVSGAAELTAGQSILFTERGTLLAQGPGGVLLDADDCGEGTVAMADGSWINAGCGPIELRAGGDVLLGRLVTANSTASAVHITSIHGGVFDAGDRYGPDIEANSRGAVVTITTTAAVGALGNPLETRVHGLLLRTDNSDVFIVEQDQLEVVAVDAGTGFVFLAAGCSIVDSDDGQRVDIVAGQAVLRAKAIGSPDNPLETRLARLEAVAACGGLWLVNLGDLTIGGITEDLNGLRASQAIDVRTHGALDAEEAIVSEGGSVGLTATGDIVFRALVASGGGDIRVESDGTITMLATARLDTEAGAGDTVILAGRSFVMDRGAVVEGRDGDIIVVSGGDVALSQLRTSGDVTLYAAGAVLDANGGDVNVVASHAILIARSLGDIAAGLSLDTQVASITAAATVGDVFLREADGLTVRSIVAATGDVCLVSTRGDVIVGWMQASGSLCIDVSKGSILDDGFGWTRIVADQLTLKAAVGIGMLGHPTTAQLETSVRSLVVEAATGVVLVNWGHALLIDAVTLSADSASARIVHHGGNVLVEEIALPGSGTAVLLVSTRGAVLDGNGDAPNVTAGGLSICAFLGIGNGHDQLETSVDRLALHSAAGGAYVLNDRSVELVGLWVPGCWGHVVAGDLAVAAMGTIVVSDPISSTGSGNIILQAREDVLIRAPVTACGGSVRILAEGDLLADPRGRLSSAGDVLLIADSDGSGSGTIQFAADIFVGGGFATFQLSDPGGFFSGSLSGPGGLVKRGTGSLQLTATSQNSYLGATLIEAGTLIVDGTIGLRVPAGMVTIGAAGTLSGNGTVNAPVHADALTARIVSTGNLRLGDGSAAGFDFAGTFVIGDGHVVEVRDADGAQLGVVTSIGHGAVLVARGGVEVSSGELLTGFGRVQGDVTILAGGEIAPGPGAGILTTGQLALQAGAVFTLEIFGPATGSQYDQLGVTGAALGGARLSLTGLPVGLAGGTVLVLIDNVGPRPVQGYFVDAQGRPIPEGGTVAGNGFTAVLSYVGGRGGNDVTLTVVDRLPIYVLPPAQQQDGDSERGLNIIALGEDADRAGSRRLGAATLFEPETVRPPDVENLVDGDRRELEQTDRSRPRVFFRVFDDALGVEVGQDHELEYSDLADPLGVFRRHEFPNGHYKVYVQELDSRRVRLVLDVHIYDGKVVPADYREEVAEPRPKPDGSALPPSNAAPVDAGDTSLEDAGMTPAGFAVEGNVPVGVPDAATRRPAPETFRESGDPRIERSPAGPAAALIGLAGLTTSCQLRARVRQAVNSTNGDFFRASQLLGRVRRQGSFERAGRPRVDAVR